jgi:hypothetical protein
MSACTQPQAHPARCGCEVSAETDWRNALRTANEHTKQLIAERDTLSTANHNLRDELKAWMNAEAEKVLSLSGSAPPTSGNGSDNE